MSEHLWLGIDINIHRELQKYYSKLWAYISTICCSLLASDRAFWPRKCDVWCQAYRADWLSHCWSVMCFLQQICMANSDDGHRCSQQHLQCSCRRAKSKATRIPFECLGLQSSLHFVGVICGSEQLQSLLIKH